MKAISTIDFKKLGSPLEKFLAFALEKYAETVTSPELTPEEIAIGLDIDVRGCRNRLKPLVPDQI